MPLVTISLIKGKSPERVRAISDGIQRALTDAYRVPNDDRFQIIRQLERDELIYDTDYLGVHRTDDLVTIHIVASDWRDTMQKRALYKAIADNLADDPGLRPEDVLVVLSPNGKEDWSFGNGVASYASDEPA